MPRSRQPKPHPSYLSIKYDVASFVKLLKNWERNKLMGFSLIQAIGQAGDIAPRIFTGARLENLFMRAGLSRFQPPPRPGIQRYGKNDLVASTLHAAHGAASNGDYYAEQGLKVFICLVAEQSSTDDFKRLLESVRSAGYDLQSMEGTVRLLPFDEQQAPLSQTITALEADLERLGMGIARNHYRQAVDSLVDGRAEAANGQMRAMFEAVITNLASVRGYVQRRQGEGARAITFLIDKGLLPAKEGGDYIRGLWNIIQTNGPHPGTSPVGEAYFRVQAISSAVRYLIDHFAPSVPPVP